MREGHLFTYKLHEIGQWPEWYKAAFHSSNYTPNNLTEGQRLLSGVYTLKNGQIFKASLFGIIEKGEELK